MVDFLGGVLALARGDVRGGGGVLFFMINPKNIERYSYLSNNIMIQQLDCAQ